MPITCMFERHTLYPFVIIGVHFRLLYCHPSKNLKTFEDGVVMDMLIKPILYFVYNCLYT